MNTLFQTLVLLPGAALAAPAPELAPELADAAAPPALSTAPSHGGELDLIAMLFVFMLSTFIGIGVIRRVSRLLHTPLMSLTNAISAIAVVGAIIIAGGQEYPTPIKILGGIALFASMTNIISGFLITDRMLKMFKSQQPGGQASGGGKS
jgi:H+-translocating NAD(P) transhydrogenase subunit alpha